jgi:hypothetical protein
VFVIREEHMSAFREQSLDQFAGRAVARLQQRRPRHCRAAGPEAVRKLVRLAVNRARRYEITSEQDVTTYSGMMLVFGSHFDIDPGCRWAKFPLFDSSVEDGPARGKRLAEVGSAVWGRLGLKNQAGWFAALRRARSGITGGGPTLEPVRWTGNVESVWPEKLAEVGPVAFKASAAMSVRSAEAKFGALTPAGRSVVGLLGNLFGARFFDDPVHRWARGPLAAESAVAAAGPAPGQSPLLAAAVDRIDLWLRMAPADRPGEENQNG